MATKSKTSVTGIVVGAAVSALAGAAQAAVTEIAGDVIDKAADTAKEKVGGVIAQAADVAASEAAKVAGETPGLDHLAEMTGKIDTLLDNVGAVLALLNTLMPLLESVAKVPAAVASAIDVAEEVVTAVPDGSLANKVRWAVEQVEGAVVRLFGGRSDADTHSVGNALAAFKEAFEAHPAATAPVDAA